LNDKRAMVQALYNEVLGRTGSLAELDGWVNILNQQGSATVVNAIVRSDEALGRVVDGYYLRFLGRQADAPGRAGWVRFLQQGGTEEQLENLFLTSPEYINHINTDFVQSLYLNILGRSGDTAGLSFWNNNIQALGLAGIASGFTGSAENRRSTLRTYFQTFLHRTPRDDEIDGLVSSSQDLLTLEVTVLFNAEFFTSG